MGKPASACTESNNMSEAFKVAKQKILQVHCVDLIFFYKFNLSN